MSAGESNTSLERFDYILARVAEKDVTARSDLLLRKYFRGQADIANTPLAEFRSGSARELAHKLENPALNSSNGPVNPLSERDRVFGYLGPDIADGLHAILYSAHPGDVQELIYACLDVKEARSEAVLRLTSAAELLRKRALEDA